MLLHNSESPDPIACHLIQLNHSERIPDQLLNPDTASAQHRLSRPWLGVHERVTRQLNWQPRSSEMNLKSEKILSRDVVCVKALERGKLNTRLIFLKSISVRTPGVKAENMLNVCVSVSARRPALPGYAAGRRGFVVMPTCFEILLTHSHTQ